MALVVAPVFLYPGSIVMYPVEARNFDMSTAFSFSEPVTTGKSCSFPSKIIFALSLILEIKFSLD